MRIFKAHERIDNNSIYCNSWVKSHQTILSLELCRDSVPMLVGIRPGKQPVESQLQMDCLGCDVFLLFFCRKCLALAASAKRLKLDFCLPQVIKVTKVC